MIGQIMKKWHLEFFQLYISDVKGMFQIEVSMSPLILVTIGQIIKKWQQFFKSKMAAAANLKSILSVEPTSREMNS